MMWQSCATRRTTGPMPEPTSSTPVAGLVLRRAGANDAAAVGRIHVDAWRTTYPGLLPDKYLVQMDVLHWARYWQGVLTQRVETEAVVVAEVEGIGVVGFCSCGRVRHREWPRRLHKAGEIYTLYVDPNYQGHGYGRALLQNALGYMQYGGATAAVVWVLAGNPARFFYEAAGACHVVERRTRFAGSAVRELGLAWERLEPRPVD